MGRHVRRANRSMRPRTALSVDDTGRAAAALGAERSTEEWNTTTLNLGLERLLLRKGAFVHRDIQPCRYVFDERNRMSDKEPLSPAFGREAEFWDAAVGPFLDEDGVQRLTGLTRDELAAAVANDDVLAVITSDGVPLFPVVQFGEHGELLPGLRPTVGLLHPIVDDPWDVALWLQVNSSDFDGLTAAQLLRNADIDRVLRIAKRDGSILRY
jgi:hypothetical protein